MSAPMAPLSPASVAKGGQPMKIQLPLPLCREDATLETLPNEESWRLLTGLGSWDSTQVGDSSQDDACCHGAYLRHSFTDLDPSTPNVARSRSGANLISPPGLIAPPGTPSHGSTLHGTGNCRPCAWFWKPSGCQNGKECGHCHICPQGEIKARKKNKLTMMRLGLATPTQSLGPLSFGLPLVTMEPWMCQDGVLSLNAEFESTNASGSEQGSSTVTLERLTASPSTDRGSAANDSLSGSERDDQEAAHVSPGPPPGLKAPPNTPSHGSASHHLGTCRPCAWYWKPTGCQNGRDCKYCHICSDGELKVRKKSKQNAMRLGLVTPKKDGESEQDARYALSLAACI